MIKYCKFFLDAAALRAHTVAPPLDLVAEPEIFGRGPPKQTLEVERKIYVGNN
jgi:hypothetical protein